MKNDKGRSPGICFYVDTPNGISKANPQLLSEANPEVSVTAWVLSSSEASPPKGISEAYPQRDHEIIPTIPKFCI